MMHEVMGDYDLPGSSHIHPPASGRVIQEIFDSENIQPPILWSDEQGSVFVIQPAGVAHFHYPTQLHQPQPLRPVNIKRVITTIEFEKPLSHVPVQVSDSATGSRRIQVEAEAATQSNEPPGVYHPFQAVDEADEHAHAHHDFVHAHVRHASAMAASSMTPTHQSSSTAGLRVAEAEALKPRSFTIQTARGEMNVCSEHFPTFLGGTTNNYNADMAVCSEHFPSFLGGATNGYDDQGADIRGGAASVSSSSSSANSATRAEQHTALLESIAAESDALMARMCCPLTPDSTRNRE